MLLLVAFPAGSLAGQAPARWARSVYPTGLNLSGNTGPQVGVGFGYTRRAHSLASHILDASLTATGGCGWRGSWFGSLAFRAPGLWPGWRVVVTTFAQREARFEFLGLGNESAYVPDSVDETQPYFYKLRRTRYRALLEGTRAIGSGWSVALAAGISHTRFDSLPGASVFLSTYGPAVVEPDQTARISVLLDTRNNEYDPRRGLFLELSATVGSGGGGYTRFTSVTRAYVPLGTRASAALKLAAAHIVGRPPLSARFELPLWETSVEVLARRCPTVGCARSASSVATWTSGPSNCVAACFGGETWSRSLVPPSSTSDEYSRQSLSFCRPRVSKG